MTPPGMEEATEKTVKCQNLKIFKKTFPFPGTYRVDH